MQICKYEIEIFVENNDLPSSKEAVNPKDTVQIK